LTAIDVKEPAEEPGKSSEAPPYPEPARAEFTATLLKDGSILLIGGNDPSGQQIQSCLQFAPSTSTWKEAPPTHVARAGHTATLLADGRVLVVGGDGSPPGQPAMTSAELYDPMSRAWAAAASPATPRRSHAAARLQEGRVLIVGGVDPENKHKTLRSAELFDPASGTWRPAGTLSTSRSGHSATLLDDGRVLVAGGHKRPTRGWWDMGILSSTEIFEPKTLTWRPAASLPGPGHSGHTAVLLPGQKVFLGGGWSDTGMDHVVVSSDVDLFDATTDTWTRAGTLDPAYETLCKRTVSARRWNFDPVGRIGHTATALTDGRMMLVGGLQAYDGPPLRPVIFDPRKKQWSYAGALRNPRFDHVALLLPDGRVVFIGGELSVGSMGNQSGQPRLLTRSVEIYEPK
jgi:N-acetylneuraminic acid mutarotase